MKYVLLIVVLFSLLNTLLHADEMVYVTDSLRLRIYIEPNDTSEVLETLSTGDSVEVIVRQGVFSQIRTYDGLIGWVKSAFLVSDPPAVLLNQALIDQNDKLEAQIQELKSENSNQIKSNTERNKVLERELAIQKKANEELHNQLRIIQQEKLNQEQSNNHYDFFGIGINFDNSIMLFKAILILICAALLIIVGGFLLGLKQSTRRLRKRLHGYRLG